MNLRCFLGLHDWRYSMVEESLRKGFQSRGLVVSNKTCKRCDAGTFAVLGRGARNTGTEPK